MSEKKYKTGKIRERNSEKILAAAEEEFVLHGFKGATIQAVADRAKVPKANVHYYFKNKNTLYIALLEHVMATWNEALTDITPEDDPAETLKRFIQTKMQLSYTHPNASKIFAMEIIQGAPRIKDHIGQVMQPWVEQKSSVIQSWIDQGKMRPIDPTHLIFMIWATTQHYADFDTQVLKITNQDAYTEADIDHITHCLTSIILRGCGIEVAD